MIPRGWKKGDVKALLVGPAERSSLIVTLIECSGMLSGRLPRPDAVGVLSVDRQGTLIFTPRAAAVTFAENGTTHLDAGTDGRVVVLASEEQGRAGWGVRLGR